MREMSCLSAGLFHHEAEERHVAEGDVEWEHEALLLHLLLHEDGTPPSMETSVLIQVIPLTLLNTF